MASGLIPPSILETPDNMVSVDLEMPRFYVDKLNGNITCAQCGKLGVWLNGPATGSLIRHHAMTHIQKLRGEDLEKVVMSES